MVSERPKEDVPATARDPFQSIMLLGMMTGKSVKSMLGFIFFKCRFFGTILTGN